MCPLDVVTGFTLFVEDEDRNVNAILTRSELEARMVVHLAGRCAEKLVNGEGNMTGGCVAIERVDKLVLKRNNSCLVTCPI